MNSLARKCMAAVLSVSMLVTSAVPAVMGAEPPKGSANTFHLVAFGDSIAAGYNLSTLTESQRSTVNYANQNVLDPPEDAYPQVAGARIRDALLEEGYLKSADDFSCANLGTIGYNGYDFVTTLNDPDYIANRFVKGYERKYGKALEAYQADAEAYRQGVYAKTAEELPQALQADDPFQTLSDTYGLQWEDREAFELWYASFLTEGAWDAEKFSTWFDPWFEGTYYPYHLELIQGAEYKWYDLYRDNIAKADAITIDIGSNNLTQNIGDELTKVVLGENAEYDEETGAYKNLENPALFVIFQLIMSFVGRGEINLDPESIQALIEPYREDLTRENILAALQMLNGGGLDHIGYELVDASLPLIVEFMEEARQINHDAGKDALFALVGHYGPFGNSLVLDGETRDLWYLLKQVLLYMMNPQTAEESENAALFASGQEEPDAATITEEELQEGIARYEEAVAALAAALEDSGEEAENVAAMTGDLSSGESGEEGEEPANPERDAYIAGLEETISETIRYPLMYLLIGRLANPTMLYFNEKLQKIAEEYGVLYIDVYDIPNNDSFDPHPEVPGHHAIGNHIADALIQDIKLPSDFRGALTGPTQCFYGHDVTLDIVPAEGYELTAFTVNGKVTEGLHLQKGKITLSHVTEDVKVGATFTKIGSAPVPSAKLNMLHKLLASVTRFLRGTTVKLRDIFSSNPRDDIFLHVFLDKNGK